MQNIVLVQPWCGVIWSNSYATSFLLTFTNIKRTDKRLEKDEKKEYKNFKMIDLSTHKERMSIQQWALMFKMENDVITQKYNILFSNYNVNFETENKKHL